MGEVATETPAVVAAVPETQEEITNLESEIIRQIVSFRANFCLL